MIGHGAYGVVVSANNKKTNQKVAIKKVTTLFLALLTNEPLDPQRL